VSGRREVVPLVLVVLVTAALTVVGVRWILARQGRDASEEMRAGAPSTVDVHTGESLTRVLPRTPEVPFATAHVDWYDSEIPAGENTSCEFPAADPQKLAGRLVEGTYSLASKRRSTFAS